MNHRLSKVPRVPLLAGKQCFSRKVRRHCFWRSSGTPSVRRADRRRGAVLVMVLVCAMVALVIFASMVKLAAAGRRVSDEQAWQAQASWLAESGLERAAWRLAADADYTGETWALSADQLSGANAATVEGATIEGATVEGATVRIEVEAVSEQPKRRLVRIRADYPDHPQHRSRQSKQAVVEVEL